MTGSSVYFRTTDRPWCYMSGTPLHGVLDKIPRSPHVGGGVRSRAPASVVVSGYVCEELLLERSGTYGSVEQPGTSQLRCSSHRAVILWAFVGGSGEPCGDAVELRDMWLHASTGRQAERGPQTTAQMSCTHRSIRIGRALRGAMLHSSTGSVSVSSGPSCGDGC